MDTDTALSEVHRAYTILEEVFTALRSVQGDSLFSDRERRIYQAVGRAIGELSDLEEVTR